MTIKLTEIESRPHNSRFAKAGGSWFYASEVLNSSFVHLIKFSAENPRLRKAAKRYVSGNERPETTKTISKWQRKNIM